VPLCLREVACFESQATKSHEPQRF
jgi:hypothetical protein